LLKKIFVLIFIFCFSVRVCFALSAQSAILIDGHTGRIIMEQNAYQKRGMASTTKIMTLLVAVEKGNISDVVTISNAAAHVEGSSIWLKSGEKVTLETLLYGLMLNSGNDSAAAIAEHIGGSVPGFVAMMNEKVKRLGLSNTSFTNPHGLDNVNHYTTAYDLAQITRYALSNELFAKIVATKSKSVNENEGEFTRHFKNHNKMLYFYDNSDGVKTGFTKKSGRCLVSSATRDGLKLIAVTLNASDDWRDHTEMLNFGFSKYKLYSFANKNDYIKTVPVKGGTAETVSVYAKNNIEASIKDNEQNDIKIVYNIPKEVTAPIAINQTIGTVDLYLGGTCIARSEAVANVGVEKYVKSNFFNKLNYLFLELLSNFSSF